jgi:F-type H+-transporting ATPase subunit c
MKREKYTMNLGLAFLAAGIGAGIAILGAGLGIGRLAASAMEGTARQPAAGGDIRTSMIIAAALIEGATLFALVICIILATKT